MNAQVQDRRGPDRRSRSFRSYIYGSFNPRRRGPRRTDDLYPIVDWHSPRVLGLIVAILLMCVADGVLTLVLIRHGAVEANPVMALFVPHNVWAFAFVKWFLTGAGMCVLAACSRMLLFRKIPGETLLYVIAACYAVLLGYELHLLEHVPLLHSEFY